jgi:glyoxylase-like metal-dependent hydrolase (beta-lactamase superfamily II)
MTTATYQTLILQDGELPLSSEGRIDRRKEHRCTATLIWPAGVEPAPTNSLVVDPCFTSQGWSDAVARLEALGISPAEIGYYFVTHPHFDHMLAVPQGVDHPNWQLWEPGYRAKLPRLSSVACPGHATDLHALKFPSEAGEVWIVGDAILSLEWLLDWHYYWPNGYDVDEIIQTWRTVAAILAGAEVVIPGHGPAIDVSAALLRDLMELFPEASYAASCPDVMATLTARQIQLMGRAK